MRVLETDRSWTYNTFLLLMLVVTYLRRQYVTTWTHSNEDLSICVHDVYRVTTCRPGRGHIVAAARLQLVIDVSR